MNLVIVFLFAFLFLPVSVFLFFFPCQGGMIHTYKQTPYYSITIKSHIYQTFGDLNPSSTRFASLKHLFQLALSFFVCFFTRQLSVFFPALFGFVPPAPHPLSLSLLLIMNPRGREQWQYAAEGDADRCSEQPCCWPTGRNAGVCNMCGCCLMCWGGVFFSAAMRVRGLKWGRFLVG